MNIKASFAVAALSAICAIAPANAATFVYRDQVPESGSGIDRINNQAGNFGRIRASFNDKTDVLNWSSTFTRNKATNNLSDGAWLVLSDGNNPKFDVDEYAILYLDADAEKVSIFNYGGKNSSGSYKYNDYLGSTALNVIQNGNDEVTFKFRLDATDINNSTAYGPDWKGIAFDEEIGVWFHNTAGTHTAYDSNGKLIEFEAASSGWYDTNKALPTRVKPVTPPTATPPATPPTVTPPVTPPVMAPDVTKVPEPSSVAALAVFGVAAATKLRKHVG